MTPIHELLSRIRWDAEFGAARFELAYLDKVEGQLRRIDLRELRIDRDNPSLFEVVDADGVCHHVPLHRVKRVWRNEVLIWERAR